MTHDEAAVYLRTLAETGAVVRVWVQVDTGDKMLVGAPGKDLVEAVERLKAVLEKPS